MLIKTEITVRRLNEAKLPWVEDLLRVLSIYAMTLTSIRDRLSALIHTILLGINSAVGPKKKRSNPSDE
jgi:hypothetical protein